MIYQIYIYIVHMYTIEIDILFSNFNSIVVHIVKCNTIYVLRNHVPSCFAMGVMILFHAVIENLVRKNHFKTFYALVTEGTRLS